MNREHIVYSKYINIINTPIRRRIKGANKNIEQITTDNKIDHSAEEETEPLQPQPLAKPEVTGITGILVNCMPFVRSDMWFKMGYSMSSDTFLGNTAVADEKTSCFSMKNLREWSLHIKIGRLSSLQSELGMVRPFVRVHSVDLKTGRYVLLKETQPLCPVQTKSCSLNSQAAVPHWNEDILLDAPLAPFVRTSTLILFELLDTKAPLNNSKTSKPKKTFERVAWAFLKPLGDGNSVNFGYPQEWNAKSKDGDASDKPKNKFKFGRKDKNDDSNEHESGKGDEGDDNDDDAKDKKNVITTDTEVHLLHVLQLYAFQHDNPLEQLQRSVNDWSSFSSAPPSSLNVTIQDVPESYVQWRRRVLQKIPGLLSIHIGSKRKNESPKDAQNEDDPATTEEDTKGSVENKTSSQEDAAMIKMRVGMMKIHRAPNEDCSAPNKLLHRISVGGDGAMSLSFSHSGSMLAVAGLTSDTSSSHFITGSTTYSLRVYCPNSGNELWSDLAAHHSVIYQIKWSKDDKFIVTCSGDGTSKVWNMRALVKNHSENVSVPSQSLLRAQLLQNIATHHPPVFVYSTVLIEPLNSSASVDLDTPTYLTGAYDGRIRLWKGDKLQGQLLYENEEQPPHQGAVNSMVIDDRTRNLFTGDSVGVIYVWRLDSQGAYQIRSKFRRDDLVGKKIMSLQMHPNRSKAQLLVFAEPSILRMYSTSTYKVQSEFAGAYINGTFARATLSADGRYVIAGSEDTRGSTNRHSNLDANSFVPSSSRPSRLKMWDTQSGNLITSPLSDISLPYATRDISWNEHQHMIAVAMAGPGASVSIYTSEKESVLKALERAEQTAASDHFQSLRTQMEERDGRSDSEASLPITVQSEDPRRPLIANRSLTLGSSERISLDPSSSISSSNVDKSDRKARTADIMARMALLREKKKAMKQAGTDSESDR